MQSLPPSQLIPWELSLKRAKLSRDCLGKVFVDILQANKVTKCFGELAAVKDLSFEVESGEIFGIAGPNGAGKTTLFNLVSGLYSGSGDIIFEGENLHGLRPFQICHKGVARTFQVPTLCSTVTVHQNIRVGAHFGVLKGKNEKERMEM